MRRLLFGAVAACLVLAGAEALTPKASAEVPPCVVSDTLVNSCRPWLGASAGRYPNVGTGFRAQIEAHEKRIGRSLDVVHNYHPAGDLPLNADELYFVNRPDTLVFLNWKPAVVWASAAGGDETVNSQIDQVADRFRAVSPHKVFLTLYHEPENDVSAGNCTANATAAASGSPSDYRNMWRNVHDRFAARGVDNVVWVMDYMNYPPWDCLVDQLYPGNDLVDWVMFNAYGDRLHPDYAANVSHFYQLLTANSDVGHDYLSKPWGIVEWNYQNATEAAAVSYYDQAKAALDAHRFPRLKAYLTFDNIGPEGNENRVNYVSGVLNAVTQAHYTAFAGDPVLVGDGVPLPDISAPSAFIRAPVADTTVQGTVDVAADVSDETGVSSVRLRVDGADGAVDAVEPFAPALLHWDSTAVANGPHQLSVQATDAAGNTATSQAVTVVVGNPDVRPPSVPDGLGAVALSDSAVDVSWNAATD
ncbi:MAG: hypothetical protein JWP40_86, partial [Blastococcus sp.]|nr:hypothetical protein [Blastococcus sp.]